MGVDEVRDTLKDGSSDESNPVPKTPSKTWRKWTQATEQRTCRVDLPQLELHKLDPEQTHVAMQGAYRSPQHR